MEEIPLVYPDHAETSRRYDIDFDGKRLKLSDSDLSSKQHQQQSSSASTSSNNAAAYLQSLDEALLGAASVSSVNIGGQELLVTTSALIEKPNIISVALSWKKYKEDVLDSPAIIELDTKDLRVVAIRAFATEGADDGISLVLVGCRGTIVAVSLDENLLAETDAPLKVLNREDYIPAPLLEQVGPSNLQGNMISFLPSKKHLIVMALPPLILTIDWKETGISSVWSETQCKEDMVARAAPFTGMIANLPSLILGKIDGDVVDMAPIAALCVSTNSIDSKDADSTAVLVFSLHSDASIRKWKIDPEKSFTPIAVTTLESNKLALPSTWSDGIKSVALCARLYEQTFALAVHIKTNTISSYNEGVSDCNIWVFEGNEKTESFLNCLVMKIPNDTVSLVGMSFSPSQRRCALTVVFEAVKTSKTRRNRDSVASGIKIVNYPPSLLSIVSSEPEVIDSMDLDKIATTELTRFRSLPYGSIVLKEIEGEDDDEEFDAQQPFTVDQALNKLDSLYMKHLFRPIFPRGNGTVLAPSAICIRRALSKLVHGAIKEHGMSVELETIKTLYEWRSRDKRKYMMGSPSKMSRKMLTPDKEATRTTPRNKTGEARLSVYESFFEPDEDVEGADVMVQDEFDEFEEFDEEIFSEVEAHENRWQRLLYQIWEEEQILRSPQCVSWLESLPTQILVRGNVTTALTSNGRSSTNSEISWKNSLQEGSRNIIELIEADHDKSKNLYEIEEQLAFIVSNGQLAISPPTSITERLMSLGRWAHVGKSSDKEKLRELLSQIPMDDLVDWIEDRPSDIGIFNQEQGSTNVRSDTKWNGQQVAKVQLRHASCSFAIRATDFVRRSRLSKCIILLELGADRRAIFAAFRAYLQSIAILWTSAQRVKTDTAFRTSTGNKMRGRKICFDDDGPRHSSPPTKRSSFGDNTTSILMPSNSSMSTTLDVVMIKISQDVAGSFNAGSSPFSAITMLSGSFVDLIFAYKGKTIVGARRFMPELSVLPVSQDRERPTDHPDLALRLLAPFVAFQIPDDLPESVAARKEELSSCLLHAALSTSFSANQKSVMRKMACDLLVPKNQDHSNPVQKDYTKEGLMTLKSVKANRISGSVDDLRRLMHTMIPNVTSADIMRLCELATAKALFCSYASVPDAILDDMTRSHSVQIAKLMLRLSQILHRLSILERYVTRSEGTGYGDDYNSISLLKIISDAIDDMEATFPEDFLKKMPEYISIWTRKFNHAVRSGRWIEAYDACVKNPLEVHRENNFNRLVRAMVDSGALHELLDMCTQLGMESSTSFADMDDESKESESIDLYDIASSVLLTYADCDVYDSRATSSYNTKVSDYQGALYALHASQEQWRRAAQSLDLRYVNAEKALRRFTGKSGINVQTSELRDGLIVQDLVLSACGSANAIQLVKDPDYRFLVSGEYGKFSVIQSGNDTIIETPNKLKRGRSKDADSMTKENGDTVDRLSKFMVDLHLDGRAIRSLALRTLFFDRSTSYAFAKYAFRRGIDTSQIDVDELFKNGYYQFGLLLAKAQNKVYRNGKAKPGGNDIFGNYLSRLMGEYLVPLASSDDDTSRPTLQQLQLAIDTASPTESTASYIVTERSVNLARLEKSALKAATFVLLKELTTTHSTAETPFALDVAFSFLDRNSNKQLPVWLERLLLGVDLDTVGGGAFSPRFKVGCEVYLGNPSALLRLYTQRGMFFEACNVVTLILDNNSRAAKAASRLPEKGNIDCVPYHSIDVLWNLIEIASSKGAYDYDEKRRILKARKGMEEALKTHFEFIQVGEMGLRSARILNA